MNRIVRLAFTVFLQAIFLPGLALSQTTVWTYHNDNFRSGVNTNEQILNPYTVNASYFGKLFTYPVDGYVYAQPLYIPNVTITNWGVHNVLIVVTEHNSVYAFDADNPGAGGGLLWETDFNWADPTPDANLGIRDGGLFGDVVPEVGVTSTPVMDTNTGILYLDSFSYDNTNYYHKIRALHIGDGTECNFSPVIVGGSVPGAGVQGDGTNVTFVPQEQIQRSALTLANGIVYVAFASYNDADPFHGWIFGFNAANLQPLANYVFNTTPNSTTNSDGIHAGEGGIWMGGDGLAVDENSNLYVMTGNGSYTAGAGLTNSADYGDSFLKFSTTNGLTLMDYFTPYDQAVMAAGDRDLGSGGMILLPDQTGPYSHLLVGSGKEGKIYLVNRDQLTFNDNHYDFQDSTDQVVETMNGFINPCFSTPVYFNGMLYFATSKDRLRAFAIGNSQIAPVTAAVGDVNYSSLGATPSISAESNANAVIWTILRTTGSTNPAVLVAYKASDISAHIYDSSQATNNRDQLGMGVKMAVPTVADGKVFVGYQYAVSVFGLLGGQFAFTAPAYSVSATETNMAITVNRLDGTNGAVQVNYSTVTGGTAIGGVDYAPASGTLSWADGQSGAQTFNVPILGNNQNLTNVTVNLSLSSPAGGAALNFQSSAVLTISESPRLAWNLAHFGTNAYNPSIAGDLADPAQDGIPNLLKYAEAIDPLVPYTNATLTGVVVTNQFQLQFNRNTYASDLTYVLQFSSDLANWNTLAAFSSANGWSNTVADATVSESATNGVPPDAFVNVTVTASTNGVSSTGPNQFYRLQVYH